MQEITFLTFNFGNAGRYSNGPGICLYNFIKIIRKELPGVRINVFTHLNSNFKVDEVNVKRIGNSTAVMKAVDNSDIVHHWSGLWHDNFERFLRYAHTKGKKVIIGPNVLDCVEFKKEKEYLKKIDFDKILVVNLRLKFLISKMHKISLDRVDEFMIGPDPDLWYPRGVNNKKILWKGNGKQYVKDIKFALEVSKKLPQYQFEFIGYPNPYNYFNHIEQASQAKLYFSTSLSETMGLALAEQWAAGVPSVTHPKIHLHGINYQTGIITNRDVKSYCEAIIEIMENKHLHSKLSQGASEFIKTKFGSDKIINNYLDIVNSL